MHSCTLIFLTVIASSAMPFIISANSFRSWRWSAVPNARLSGYVLGTKTATSLLSCMAACGYTSGCRTVNHIALTGLCELNSADDRWSDVVTFQPDTSFSYYRRITPLSPADVDSSFAASKCSSGHLLLDNICHEILNATKLNFTASVTYCQHKYGRLAILNTTALEGILSLLPSYWNTSKYYINMIRMGPTNTDMYWRNGAKCNLAIPPWKSGQPDMYLIGTAPEDCGAIESSLISANVFQFSFNDVPCNLNDRGLICQYDPYVYLTW